MFSIYDSQAPTTTSRDNSWGSSGGSFKNISQTSQWESIVRSLNNLLSTLKNNFVPLVLVQHIFTEIFSYINIQLFNRVLVRRECCTFSYGEYLKAGLDELELWCGHAQEFAGPSWNELKHVRQAVGFLVIHQKSRITYDDLITDLCPILSIQQLYKICTIYGDDSFNTPSVAEGVISSMKLLMTEESNDVHGDSFLLEDNSCIPFSIDDISSSLRQADFTNVKPATELLENPAFEFLHG